MKWLINTIAMILLLVLAQGTMATSALDIAAPEARELAEQGKLTIVDIRRPEEWRQTGIAEGAVRVPMEHPRGERGFLEDMLEVAEGDLEAPIAIICRTGNRTTHLQRYLHAVGFKNVVNIKEGMAGSTAGPGWIKRGLPVEPCPRC